MKVVKGVFNVVAQKRLPYGVKQQPRNFISDAVRSSRAAFAVGVVDFGRRLVLLVPVRSGATLSLNEVVRLALRKGGARGASPGTGQYKTEQLGLLSRRSSWLSRMAE